MKKIIIVYLKINEQNPLIFTNLETAIKTNSFGTEQRYPNKAGLLTLIAKVVLESIS